MKYQTPKDQERQEELELLTKLKLRLLYNIGLTLKCYGEVARKHPELFSAQPRPSDRDEMYRKAFDAIPCE